MRRPTTEPADRPGRFAARRLAPLLAALLLVALGSTPLGARDQPSPPSLPRTDGQELPAPAPPLGQIEGLRLFVEAKRACDGPCVTPFGQVLGMADGAPAHSNCITGCIRPEYHFLDLETGQAEVRSTNVATEPWRYVGITYQCVGYARLWWMKNRNLTFGDVDDAQSILYLTEGANARTGEPVPLGRSVNGTARRPPQRGDLVVYAADRADPEWRYGHVAVVVAVDLERGMVSLAEENYDNAPWLDPHTFARQVRLFEINGRYTLLDLPDNAWRNTTGGRITGWLYPTQ